ncbi:MAG: LamG-like jellyroll fold domain-containing protein, partial [Flavobacteriales bacterium]
MLHFRAAFSLFFLILLASVEAQGDPGDTTWVQTFTWEAQDNPATAYDSPGRRWFQFPSGEDTTYRKILMYHRLKCFENGTAGNLGYPCGEWDYLTYNWLFDHTGMYDSTALTHPQYLLNDASFDAATLILNPEGGQPADTIIRVLQTAHHEFVGGSDTWSELQGEPSTELLSSALGDGVRHQWLWTADELDALGWENGNVAWRMSLPRAGNLSAASVARATLRARWTTATALDGIVTSGWLTLVDGPVAANDMQWAWELDFVQALTREEGMNLLLDLSLDGVVSGQGEEVAIQAFEVADTLAQTCNPLAPGAAQYVHMNGGDRMELDPSELLALDTTVTVECWIRGDAAVMPANTTLFEGVNASDQREMNVHAPWSNGRVYWDCGFDGGYDRIDEAAQAGLYEGNWVHWAFTKDASTGVMKMFVNGALWHSGGGKDHLIGEIVRMNLGGSAWATNDYYGDVAAFRVWDVALSGAILSEWMDRASLDALLEHPHADRLLGAVNMLGYDGEVTDQGALAGWIHGDAARRAFEPREAFLDAAPAELRPALVLEGGAMPLTAVGEALWAEAVPVPPMSVTEWEVVGNDVEWIDLHYGWDASLVTSVTTEWGDTLATYELQGEQVNYNGGELTYWSAPFEVVDRYELARYITPYGINLTLGPDGWAWVFDVTDYAPLLRDSVELEAGNWQELLDLKFAFIEGTPARDVENVTAFWKGLHYL